MTSLTHYRSWLTSFRMCWSTRSWTSVGTQSYMRLVSITTNASQDSLLRWVNAPSELWNSQTFVTIAQSKMASQRCISAPSKVMSNWANSSLSRVLISSAPTNLVSMFSTLRHREISRLACNFSKIKALICARLIIGRVHRYIGPVIVSLRWHLFTCSPTWPSLMTRTSKDTPHCISQWNQSNNCEPQDPSVPSSCEVPLET